MPSTDVPNPRFELTLLYGGTFDPVHSGHLDVLADVTEILGPDHVHVVLSARPPHRDKPLATVEARQAMLELAMEGRQNVTVDSLEIDRAGPSYTLWTLRRLRSIRPGSAIAMLIGADSLSGLDGWYRGTELTAYCHLVVFSRPGYQIEVPTRLQDRVVDTPGMLRESESGRLFLLEIGDYDVSASEIRDALSGEGRKDLLGSGALPAAVATYIDQERLYH